MCLYRTSSSALGCFPSVLSHLQSVVAFLLLSVHYLTDNFAIQTYPLRQFPHCCRSCLVSSHRVSFFILSQQCCLSLLHPDFDCHFLSIIYNLVQTLLWCSSCSLFTFISFFLKNAVLLSTADVSHHHIGNCFNVCLVFLLSVLWPTVSGKP